MQQVDWRFEVLSSSALREFTLQAVIGCTTVCNLLQDANEYHAGSDFNLAN